jgi:hypothetical protein
MGPQDAADAAMRRAMARRLRQIARAREDPNAYIEIEAQTPKGARYRQAPFHRELQEQFGKPRSVTHAPIYSGKTQALMHRLVWETGHDLNISINYVSATTQHPQNVHRAWQQEITDNPRVRVVFPHLKKGKPWSTNKSNVRRDSREPSPTFRVFGAFSQSLMGSRAKVICFDDLLNFENTFTDYACKKMDEWMGDALSRGTQDNRVIFIGNVYKDNDQLHREAKKKGVSYRRYEATAPDREDEIVAWQTTMPVQPHEERLVERLDEHGEAIPIAPDTLNIVTLRQREIDLGPIRTMMMLRSRVPSMAMGRFSKAGFDRCLRRGQGLRLTDPETGEATKEFMTAAEARGLACFTGVDLGHKKKPGADWTVLFTAARMPNGDRQIVDIRSGRWNGTEIRDRVLGVKLMFDSHVFVEENGGQSLLIDVISEIEAVRPHHTGRNKHDIVNGVESLATEMDQGRWILPCSDNEVMGEEVGKFVKGCMSYDPTQPAEHTDDFLMAAWICREGMRGSLVDGLTEGGIWMPGTSALHGLYDR